jgi:hypothetical protein
MSVSRQHEAPFDEVSIGVAHNARIAVFITFHYRSDRLKYLCDVLRVLGEYPNKFMKIHICTNSSEGDKLDIIYNLARNLLVGNKILEIYTFPNLENPYDLTWSHKSLLKECYFDLSYSHFIYLEDDVRLSFTNFIYFEKYKNSLREHGLIPSFVRVEYNLKDLDLYLSDHHAKVNLDQRIVIQIEGVSFINTDFPYMAMFILDRHYAEEYIKSRSFDQYKSAQISPWWIAERAAMGLTWEDIPINFSSRLVVPINLNTRLLQPICLIHHIPDNYTNNYSDRPEFVAGRIRVKDGFI